MKIKFKNRIKNKKGGSPRLHKATKWLLCTVLALGSVLATAYFGAVGSHAEDKTDTDTGIVYTVDGNNATIKSVPTDFAGTDGSFTIPSQVTLDAVPYNVTAIGDNAFKDNTVLTSITIPNSVTTMGANAFKSCSKLASVTIPMNVESIGDYAFAFCGLENVVFEEGTKTVDNEEVPVGVTALSANMFNGCSKLNSVSLPSTLTSIGTGSFYQCSALTSITLPDHLTSIGTNALRETGLTSIVIKDDVATIGPGAFMNCASLASVTLPTNTNYTRIDNEDFQGCTALTSITIPANITSIGQNVFKGATSLASVTFANGSNLATIGASAFRNCTALTGITIPASVTSIGGAAFQVDSDFTTSSSLTSVTFESGSNLSSIGPAAFEKTALKSITLPDSVETIGGYVFHNCYSLTSVTLPTNVNFTKVDNYSFNNCTALTSITIPDSVTTINMGAFQGCSSLAAVNQDQEGVNHWPSAVTTMSDSCFKGCSALTNMTIPNTVSQIGYYVFQDATGLTSVTLPNNITQIRNSTFSGCTALTGITIPASVTEIGLRAFEKCYAMGKITIPRSVTSIGDAAFEKCNGNSFGVEFESGSSISSIGSFVFAFSGITGIDLPVSVTSISNSAFQGSRLISITLPENMSSVDGDSFVGCGGLKYVFAKNTASSGPATTVVDGKVPATTNVIVYEVPDQTGVPAGKLKVNLVEVKQNGQTVANPDITLYSNAMGDRYIINNVPAGVTINPVAVNGEDSHQIYGYTAKGGIVYAAEVYWNEPTFVYDRGTRDLRTGNVGSSLPANDDNEEGLITQAMGEKGDYQAGTINKWYGFDGVHNRIFVLNRSNAAITATYAVSPTGADENVGEATLQLYDYDYNAYDANDNTKNGYFVPLVTAATENETRNARCNVGDPDGAYLYADADKTNRFGNETPIDAEHENTVKTLPAAPGNGTGMYANKIFFNISGAPGADFTTNKNKAGVIGTITITFKKV